MKKKMIGAMLVISMLAGTVMVQAHEHVEDTEKRTADIELSGVKVQFEETLHECEQYKIWYSADLLKVSEFGGNECFILKEQDKPEESELKFTIVVEDDEDTVLSLEEPLAAYTSSGETYETLEIGKIETRDMDSGYVLDWAQVICDDTANYFYLVRDTAEENVLYITATLPVEEQKTYFAWLDKMVESIEFTTETRSEAPYTEAPSTEATYTASLPQCSLCEEYKECGTYTVDGVTYNVCDDDYAEFAEAFGLNRTDVAPTLLCSLCEQYKECGVITVDGGTYNVCDDCYGEFEEAFGLNDTVEEETAPTLLCSLCEQYKECGVITVSEGTYNVCDDCYGEFAEAFGLN